MSNQSVNNEFYKEITLDSSQFRTGTANRPTFYFNTFMDDMDFVNVSRVIVPTTYYVFSAPNYNTITINGTTATIAAGNYTAQEWITAVLATPAATAITLAATYSPITNKLTFTASATITLSFTGSMRMYELIGLNPGSNTNGTSTFVSPNVVQFSGPNYVLLRTRMASVFNGQSLYFAQGDSQVSNDQFVLIPLDQNRNSTVFYTSIADRYFEWFDTQTRAIEIYFTLGTRTEEVNFNGVPFQVTLAGFSRGTMHSTKIANNIKTIER